MFNSKPKGLVGLHPRPEGRSFTPWLDKKLEEHYWVVTQVSNEAVVSDFILTVNSEAFDIIPP